MARLRRVKTTLAYSSCIAALLLPAIAAAENLDYAVVVSEKTRTLAEWQEVVTALVQKHHGTVVTFGSSVDDALPVLQQIFPRYVCFVAQAEETTREFVARVHRLTRKLDDDPYTDCFWGILTGYDAANALRIASVKAPLTVRRAVAGTSIPLRCFDEGTWYCELKKNRVVRKTLGQAPQEGQGPNDTTKALVDLLNDGRCDLFVTSGHATERDWQIGFAYRNGSFRCEAGRLYGRDLEGQRYPVESSNPKVYMAVGNCLMGHVNDRDAMALAFMNSGGVVQMLGYTVNTWFGYAGWGCLDYFVEQPGRYTLTEAFFANQHALVHRLSTWFPNLLEAQMDENARTTASLRVSEIARAAGLTANDARGLLYDRDVLTFYGDPAWEARLAPAETGWKQTLTEDLDLWTLKIEPQEGARSFELKDPNGSQRGGRPFIHYFPRRLGLIQLMEGQELNPVIADDFILVPRPSKYEPDRTYRVIFKATPFS